VKLATTAGWACVAFIVWWVIEDPTAASNIVQNIGSFLSSAASGISNFFATI
jgi:hypothetical protein